MTFFHPLRSMLFLIVTFLFLSCLHYTLAHIVMIGTCKPLYYILWTLIQSFPSQKKNKQIIKVKTYTHLWADGKRGTYFLCGMTLGIFCGDQSWHAEKFLHVPFKIIVVTLAQT